MRALAVLALLLLAGCTMFSSGTAPEEKIHAGIKGLTLTLDKGNLDKLSSGDSVTLYATLSNDGAADADNAVVTITPDNKFLTLTEPGTRTFSLYGKGATNPVGEQAPLRVGLKALPLGPAQENGNGQVRFDVCYGYATDASAQVCIDPDPQSKAKKPCTMGSISLGGGQGAPVAVTKVETTLATDQGHVIPTFAITLSNVGDGTPSSPGATACGSGTYNHAVVRAWLAEDPLQCNDGESAEAVFDNTRNTVRCKLVKGIDAVAAYASVLRVEATYDYANKPVVSAITVVQR
jgi:hypothetical protein